MSDKDAWDKFEIIFKSTILGLIPLVIILGANTVAQSIKKGEIIQSSVSSLVQEQETARDIALIALDTAFPIERDWLLQKHPDDDEVVKIIRVLLEKTDFSHHVDINEFEVIIKILGRRGDEETIKSLNREVSANQRDLAISSSGITEENPNQQQQQEAQSNISQILSVLQSTVEPLASPDNADNCPSGIRLIFIQYGQDSSRELAEEIQGQLSSCGILAPGIEQVNGVQHNDIRYAISVDEQAANGLKNYIENYVLSPPKDDFFAPLIDLSDHGYNSATGQFEIWLQ